VPGPKTYIWKDPTGLTIAALIVMALDVLWAASGLLIQVTWGRNSDFGDVPVDAMSVPQLVGWAHSMFALLTLSGGIVLIFWILRASKNAHVLKGRALDNSPMFAALWWYVIPFMSLFKPVEAMGEIWDVSAADREGRKRYRPVLWVWWAASLAAGVLASFDLILNHDPLVSELASAAAIVQCAAFAFVAKRISDLQIEKRTVLASSDEPERPLGVLERLNG
jgi:hypothetical protein